MRFDARKNAIHSEIRDILAASGNRSLAPCLTTDAWTSNQNESYIAVTLHIVNGDWRLVSYMISLYHSEERHTAEHLREALESVMDEWGFERSFAVVSDNAANVVLALNDCTRVQHLVRCIGHTSQLAINDSLKSIQLITHALAVMRGLAKFFRRSGPR